MDFNQERYFFLSGLISISLFMSLLFITGYSVIIAPKTEQFAMIKSDVINVSIAISESKVSEEPIPQKDVSSEVSEPVVQEEKVTKTEPVPEISDLFAQVKPDKTAKKEKEDTKRREELNTLEKDLLTRKDTPRFTDKVNKVELAKPTVKLTMQGGSTGPIVDKYLAKCQGLVQTYFHDSAINVRDSAVVLLRIDSKGKMINFKILKYAKNDVFNGEINWLKDRLNSIRFPESPDGNEGVITCTLTTKE